MDERLKFIARLLDGEKMAVRCRQFGISRKILTHALQRLDFPLYAPPQMQDEFPRGYEEQEKAQDANDTAPTQS